MNKMQIQLFFVIFSLIFTQIPAYCQTTYSLHELVKLANIHAENIKIAEDDLYIAEQEKARALSVLIPRATSFGSMSEYKMML